MEEGDDDDDEISAVPDTDKLIVNIEIAQIKITWVINLKWHNLDYSSCHQSVDHT